MKTKFLFFIFISLFFVACSDDKDPKENGGDDGGGEETERPETLAWIEDTMREHYYWYSEIPEESKLDYKLGEKDFFKSLLSKKDGKVTNGTHSPYSYIEDLSEYTRSSIIENYSYGFEFTGIYLDEDEIGALVLYVVPNSPATDAGLRRGDWIKKIDGKPISTIAAFASLQGDVAKTISVARWKPDAEDPRRGEWVDERDNVALPAARKVVDNPVHTYDVYTRGNKKVGYLLYNSFTDGTGGTDQSYDNELRTLSSGWFTGVDEFVLDLRYNNGGLITSAMLLCAILAPNADLDKTYAYLKLNGKQKPNEYTYIAKTSLLSPGGKNLDLNRLYVLTSPSTASSSELIINSLRVFMDVIVIGDLTVGKNVGSVTYPNDNDPYPYGTTTWSMHPIIGQISNAQGFTDYEKGFKPGTYKKGEKSGEPAEEGLYVDEAFEPVGVNTVALVEMFDLGDEKERMLKAALDMIDPDGAVDQISRSSRSISTKTYKKVGFNSIDRKATNGVVINTKE